MVNMREIFAYDRIRNQEMDLVPLNEEESAKYSLRPGDLLFARQSLKLEGAGKCSIVLGAPEITTFESHLIRVRLDQTKADPRFYYYYFRSPEGHGNVQSLVMQVAAAGIRGSELARLAVPHPPLLAQNKIAALLSAYDALIENNIRRIKILEEMARLIYNEWFAKFRFPGCEKAEMVDSELGPIPDGWPVVRVEDIVKRVSAGKKYDNKTASPNGSVPILDQGKSGIIGYHDDKPGVVASEETPVIVFANHTCYQRIIQFPFSAIQNVLPFLPHPERTRNIYWLHWATKDLVKFNDYKGHWPEFMSKQLLLPPADICSAFGQLVKPSVQLSYELEQKNVNLRATRDLLLSKLMSGELDVEELDIVVPQVGSLDEAIAIAPTV
jgi:type I restriction enzyme, S subunit